jgi:hypothetical protein
VENKAAYGFHSIPDPTPTTSLRDYSLPSSTHKILIERERSKSLARTIISNPKLHYSQKIHNDDDDEIDTPHLSDSSSSSHKHVPRACFGTAAATTTAEAAATEGTAKYDGRTGPRCDAVERPDD